ncbi:integrative and conjugative element protein (TIGR02256 family) [Bradyrhizobium sp. GM24.11]
MQCVTAWISSLSLDALRAEADRLYPSETGGVLIGYWADDHNVVITTGKGPGPAAIHGRYSYEHDHVWEAAQIAIQYQRSERLQVYVGDWHTHPDALSGHFSTTDKRSLRCLLRSRQTRLSRTLMVVLFGSLHDWRLDFWVAEFGVPSSWYRPRSLSIQPARLQLYD